MEPDPLETRVRALLAGGDAAAAATVEERSLLALRVDQGLAWNEVAQVLAAEGAPVEPATLMKRFERLKERLATMARAQGLVE